MNDNSPKGDKAPSASNQLAKHHEEASPIGVPTNAVVNETYDATAVNEIFDEQAVPFGYSVLDTNDVRKFTF